MQDVEKMGFFNPERYKERRLLMKVKEVEKKEDLKVSRFEAAHDDVANHH